MIRVINVRNGLILADRAEEAASFFRRFVGLMGRAQLKPGEGLHISPCRAVHTFFMRVHIDAAFLDRGRRLIKAVHNLPPWRGIRPVPGAKSVLELPAGTLTATATIVGDELAFEVC